MFRQRAIIIFILFLSVLAACRPQEAESPPVAVEPEVVVTPTLAPTLTPTSTPTIMPTATNTPRPPATPDDILRVETDAFSGPAVTKRVPSGRTLYDRQVSIALTFNREMDRHSVADALAVEPALPLVLDWEDNILTIQSEAVFMPGTTYHFTLSETAVDIEGIPLARELVWYYQLEALISKIDTPSTAGDDTAITIFFNYQMDPDSVADALQFTPDIPGKLTWNDDDTVATFTPVDYLDAATTYTISFIDSVWQDADGLPLPPVDETSFTTPPPILASVPIGEQITPLTPLYVVFDRPMNEEATIAAFQISPDIPGEFSWEETTLTFTPEGGYFDEYTDYLVTIDTSARSADGDLILNEPYTFSFRTKDLDDVASFGWGPNAQVMDVNGRRAIQFVAFSRFHENVTFDLYRLSRDQFLDKYSSGFKNNWGDERAYITTNDATFVRQIPNEPGVTVNRGDQMSELILPDDILPGFYILDIRSGHVNDQIMLILSSHVLTVKQADKQITAWVTELGGGSSPNVPVQVYARDGELVAGGTSDENGVFQTRIGDRDPTPLIVIAGEGEDVTVSGLANEWRSDNDGWWGWWRVDPAPLHYAAYIYTDRPIYKPGHLVYFKAIVRQDDDAIIQNLPEGTPVTVRIRDARNNVVQTLTLETNSFGTINGEFQLAEGAMLGNYGVEVVLDGESYRQRFKVEDYRKPDYGVSVTTNDTQFVEGERIEITVDTTYFLGEPVPDAQVQINLFQLGQNYYYSWDDIPDDEEYIWYEGRRDDISGRTDANGRFTATIDADLGWYARNAYYRANLEKSTWAIEATVNDGSHQTVSGFAIVNVFNHMEKLRLDTNGYLHRPGETFTISAHVNDIFDNPVDGRTISLSLRRWSRENRAYDIILKSAQLTTDASGVATIPFTVEEPGYYRLYASATDRLGNEITYRTYVYAFSRTYPSWYGRSNDLSIDADKESYAPGETATLLIESSFSGPALLTFERATTRREMPVDLTAPVTAVEVTIQPDDAPNIYVSINAWQVQDTTTALVGDRWESMPDAKLHTASTNLPVPVTNKTLLVTITPDKETYAPREEATFTIRVTNEAGTPVSAELSLAMVDEAIFALSEELSGSMFDAFYYERNNIVKTFDSMALIRYLPPGLGGGGGGGDLAGNPRSDFPDTAAWFPVIHTDFNGEATLTLTLPDNLTSWRLTAKATTADTQVGQGITNILVNQDIVVRPILPRTLTAGDELILSTIVHNFSHATQTINVQLFVNNSQFTIHNSQFQTITLSPGEQRIIGWPVTAVTAGEAQLIVQATIGEQTVDAVQLPLEIRPLAIPDVTTQIGQFRGTFETTVNVPNGALPMSHVRIELSRSIAGSLLEGLDYLTGFPYGCVEQTMSRALPNAVVGRAFFQLGVGNPTIQADLPPKINASLQRLYGFQHNDGGWGWWYDDSTHDYQTAWVIFGLATIADAGYEVDAGVIQRGVDWMNEHLGHMDIRTRAYALYSMAVAGHPNLEATQALAERLGDLDTFSQAALALAFHEAGQTAVARDIVDLLAETATITDSGTVYWVEANQDGYYRHKTMASTTRSTALALSALVQIRPGHELEGGVVRWLMSQRQRNGWGTTNETSYAILGLTDHLLATSFSESATSTGYTVEINGQTIASGNLGRGEPAVSLEIPYDQLQTGTNELRITQSGSGQLYYAVNGRMYVSESEIDAAGQVQITRTYWDEDGRALETIEPGQLVQVRLVVRLPQDASYILVEDHLPGGLEALNENLNTTSHVGNAFGSYRERWQSLGYNYKEVHGDRVTFFITEMDAGSHTFTYMARATHPGDFVAMPTEAYAMYDLATWGRSASAELSIVEN